MKLHPNMSREERERVIEQQMAVDLMMTPWVWTMAPLRAWWADPPAPPRWPTPGDRAGDRMDVSGDARR